MIKVQCKIHIAAKCKCIECCDYCDNHCDKECIYTKIHAECGNRLIKEENEEK